MFLRNNNNNFSSCLLQNLTDSSIAEASILEKDQLILMRENQNHSPTMDLTINSNDDSLHNYSNRTTDSDAPSIEAYVKFTDFNRNYKLHSEKKKSSTNQSSPSASTSSDNSNNTNSNSS